MAAPTFSFNTSSQPKADGGSQGGNKAGNPFKSTFIQTSVDPDVTLKIGGKDFQEYSHSLRSWSSYFDRALSSGMKETETFEFEFPERSPKEWQWIVSLMSPMAKMKVTKKTLFIALDWFDFLCSNIGLEECDTVMFNQVLPEVNIQYGEFIQTFTVDAALLRVVMDNVESCIDFELKASKSKCFAVIRQALVIYSNLFSKDSLGRITRLVKDNVECRNALWTSLQCHVPESISDLQQEVLLQNDVLHEVLHLEIIRKDADLQLIAANAANKKSEKRMVEIVEKATTVYNGWDGTVSRVEDPQSVRAAFKRDDIFGKVVPSYWGP